MHPAILHGKHPLTRLMIHDEHLRLLHAGPTLYSLPPYLDAATSLEGETQSDLLLINISYVEHTQQDLNYSC